MGREWSLLDAAPHLTTVERVIVVPPSLPSLVSLYLGSVARELVQGTPYQHSPRLLYPGEVASRVPWLACQTPGAVEVRARECSTLSLSSGEKSGVQGPGQTRPVHCVGQCWVGRAGPATLHPQ